jgi:hypothetical protein
MTQQAERELPAKLCGFDKDGSPIFTHGVFALPKRCPRCGSPDATEPIKLSAIGDSQFVIGGVKWKTLSLNVPHCKPCSSIVITEESGRTILMVPFGVVH